MMPQGKPQMSVYLGKSGKKRKEKELQEYSQQDVQICLAAAISWCSVGTGNGQ